MTTEEKMILLRRRFQNSPYRDDVTRFVQIMGVVWFFTLFTCFGLWISLNVDTAYVLFFMALVMTIFGAIALIITNLIIYLFNKYKKTK
jgi:apolipoprotein N-acyltransferase